jgi:Ankyrin repeats (many copies)
VLRSGRVVRSREAQLEHEDRLFRVLGLVGGLGFWEAWRLPLVYRELRFGFSGGGAPADMIKLGLERRGVWAKLREARAARRDWKRQTLLHLACLADVEDVQRVCELIELGWPGSVEARDMQGWTPLMIASSCGHAGIVNALLAAGADVNAATNNGWTALLDACYHGRLESARLLVAAKTLVNGEHLRPHSAQLLAWPLLRNRQPRHRSAPARRRRDGCLSDSLRIAAVSALVPCRAAPFPKTIFEIRRSRCTLSISACQVL